MSTTEKLLQDVVSNTNSIITNSNATAAVLERFEYESPSRIKSQLINVRGDVIHAKAILSVVAELRKQPAAVRDAGPKTYSEAQDRFNVLHRRVHDFINRVTREQGGKASFFARYTSGANPGADLTTTEQVVGNFILQTHENRIFNEQNLVHERKVSASLRLEIDKLKSELRAAREQKPLTVTVQDRPDVSVQTNVVVGLRPHIAQFAALMERRVRQFEGRVKKQWTETAVEDLLERASYHTDRVESLNDSGNYMKSGKIREAAVDAANYLAFAAENAEAGRDSDLF